MEIKVNRANGASNNTNDFGRTTSNESYECAFCHKKFHSPVERMNHEQKCYATTKYQEEQRKAEELHSRSKVDTERITKEWQQFADDVKHHVDTYGEPVRIGNHYFGRDIDNMYPSDDIFSDLFNSFRL